MQHLSAVIFDIVRFSIRDGPGIRTSVFFKGCPLDCWWCHNPESRAPWREPVFWEGRCIRCGACREVCPTGAVEGDGVCELCGACVDACPATAREIVGRPMTPAELFEEINKDRVFFEESGGGVTFSGGEPLMEHEFLEPVLERCRDERIHAAVDTSGYIPPPLLRRLRGLIDLFLYDLKLMDDVLHRKYTGVSNEIILRNLEELASSRASVHVRVPVIPGVNDGDENLERTGRFLSRIGLERVHLLPYHGTALDKYRRLGRPYRLEPLRAPSEDRMREISARLAAFGLDVRVGG